LNKTVKKIGLILVIIILLPAVFLTVNELTSFNENEKVIEKIYSEQLEAILFSINQYSEDVAGSWATKVDDFLDELENVNAGNSDKKIDSFFVELPSLVGFFIADSITDNQIDFFTSRRENQLVDKEYDSLNITAKNLLHDNQKVITRLFTYKRGGYRKIEPVENKFINRTSVLIFIEETPKKITRLTGLILDPNEFVFRILSPKIQKIAEDEFVISVRNPNTNFAFNSTKDFDINNFQQERTLWIFPEYTVGISLVGQTIEDLVEQRVTTNIILISLLTLVLIFGVWIVFRTVKKEVQLAQIKSDFVSNVSHELRTPLSLISMFSETLEMGRVPSEEKKKEYYKIISQESTRLGRIVNTILNFSKMEAGKRTFHFKEIDLNEFVKLIYNNYSFHLKSKGFEFTFIPKNDLSKISVDEEAVSEAIINLIDNAVKYSSDLKEIEIKTGKQNEFAFVEVNDKGIGITIEDQRKIFEKFFRASSGLVHNTKGTGLGLTLVKFIMDAHKGSIKLKSNVGKGSSFKLLFPINKHTKR
jgi:two-component system phosphate regulon sensor histidine kinase PhoR